MVILWLDIWLSVAGGWSHSFTHREHRMPVLVCQGRCDKASPTEWLKTTEIYSFSALETGSPKSRWRQVPAPSEGAREGSVSALLFLGLWEHNSRSPLLSGCQPHCLWPTPLWFDPVLTNYICNNPNSRYSPVLRCEGSGLANVNFRGMQFVP